jgi:hypothetical protein
MIARTSVLCFVLGALPNVAWAGGVTNRVSVSIEGSHRVIRANGFPDHATGRFPSRFNPNAIKRL